MAESSEAHRWAKRIPLNRVHPQDHPYVLAVLIELAKFETPLPSLQVAISENATSYSVTVLGYTKLADMVKWAGVFNAHSEEAHLSTVTGSSFQMYESGKLALIIHMDALKYVERDAKKQPRYARPPMRRGLHASSTASHLQRRRVSPEAIEWAEQVPLENVKQQDQCYVLAVLTAISQFEDPLPPLKVEIFDNDTYYSITVLGYRQSGDILTWVKTFMGINNDPMMENVTGTYFQTLESGARGIVLHVRSVKFLEAEEEKKPARGLHRQKSRRRF